MNQIHPIPTDHPLASLPREDLDLIVQLVLHSGSIKDLASSYGVSYPTIRTRLDRVIDRLRGAIEGRKPDPISEFLASLVERGELAPSHARTIKDLARQQATPPAASTTLNLLSGPTSIASPSTS